jgi:hypothetical protein
MRMQNDSQTLEPSHLTGTSMTWKLQLCRPQSTSHWRLRVIEVFAFLPVDESVFLGTISSAICLVQGNVPAPLLTGITLNFCAVIWRETASSLDVDGEELIPVTGAVNTLLTLRDVEDYRLFFHLTLRVADTFLCRNSNISEHSFANCFAFDSTIQILY